MCSGKKVLRALSCFSISSSCRWFAAWANTRRDYSDYLIFWRWTIAWRPSLKKFWHQFLLISYEYNRKQGFLVSGVEGIVTLNWEDILATPKGAAAMYT